MHKRSRMFTVLYKLWSKSAKNKRPTCFLVTMQSFMVTSCFSILRKKLCKKKFQVDHA